MNNKEKFIKIIREKMKCEHLTQKQLGDIIGVHSSSISDLLNGVTLPSFYTLIKLADYFNVSIDYLVGRTDHK